MRRDDHVRLGVERRVGGEWLVTERVEDRAAYLTALDRAGIDMDIGPFAAFIAERVRWSMEKVAA